MPPYTLARVTHSLRSFVLVPFPGGFALVSDMKSGMFINKIGTTQLHVYFALDANDDVRADYIGDDAGDNATAANGPQLVVTYR